jgi:SAM-dependent methyltransferase
MSSVFEAYARYYDLLYRDKDYGAEVNFIISQLQMHSSTASKVLDLGCGTGIHGELLARQGYRVHGIDQSADMLIKAKSRIANLPSDIASRLRFSTGDARTIRTGEKYDAVISLFHVMSYHNTNCDLKKAFATAAEHLLPGGIFLFDYWYGPAVLLQRPNKREKVLEDDLIHVHRVAEPVMRLAENIVDVNYSMDINNKITNESYQIKETHSMRYLFLPELPLLAGELDWEECKSSAWMKLTPPTADDWAGFSVIRRK